MGNRFSFLDDLNDKQKLVCCSDGNYVLTACPGSGKTRTITYRLAYLSEKYKASKKLNIAITYTNRAANEIELRLIDMGIDTESIWIGTIHQFCMQFIIRKYAMYHDKLSKGYRIIDEYKRKIYLEDIARELGISKFYINDLKKYPEVEKKYQNLLESNREIDFDKILTYSKELIDKNSFIAENIAHIIRGIHIDEYQDTNRIQYDILSKIIKANPNINILFVGDINQAIYGNLGGVAKTYEEIKKQFPVSFKSISLDGCYRSTQRIIDYYRNYEVHKNRIVSLSNIKNQRGIIKYNFNVDKHNLANEIANIIKDNIKNGVTEKEICVVAPQWYQIYPMAKELRKLMPENNFDAPDISPFKYDPLNVFFLIANLLFTRETHYRQARRKDAQEVLNILKNDYEMTIADKINKLDILKCINSMETIDNGITMLENTVDNLFQFLRIRNTGKLQKTHKEFFEKISYRISKYNLAFDYESMKKYFNENNGIVINSIHGIKGEEYTVVIAFDLLNGHLPHWGYIFNDELKQFRKNETNKILYVLCSRAKEKLFLFSEQGRMTKNGSPYSPTDELKQYKFKYDLTD